MKTKIFFHFLMLAAMIFSACTLAFKASSETDGGPNADMKPRQVISDLESGQAVNGKCSRSSDEVRLLINFVQQYCLQYPAADKFLAVYTLPESEVVRESLTIAGEEAVMLDELPGQEINRQVFVLHNDYLYQLTFMPMYDSQPAVYAQAEALYETVVNSFNFRPESNACPGCPEPEDDPQSSQIIPAH